MEASDLEQVSLIDGESFSDLLTKLLHTKVELPPHETEYFDFWWTKGAKGALVEEEDGRINGFIFCHARGRSGWIGPLAVRVDMQGKGTGKRLMAAGLKYLDQARVKWVGLDTFAQNPISVSLYLKNGFQVVGGLLVMEAPLEMLEALGGDSAFTNVFAPSAGRTAGLKAGRLAGLGGKNTLEKMKRAGKYRYEAISLDELPAIAKMERAATGFNRKDDFEFLLTSGLGVGFFARQEKRIVGYAFASIRRKSGFIAPLHLVSGCDQQPVANRLLSLCAEWLEGRRNGSTLAFCRGDDLRMFNVLLNAGFRMRSMCVTMHRTGAVGKGPIRTPFSIEKG
jgi:GNAT superfamily N-acetyltransferase